MNWADNCHVGLQCYRNLLFYFTLTRTNVSWCANSKLLIESLLIFHIKSCIITSDFFFTLKLCFASRGLQTCINWFFLRIRNISHVHVPSMSRIGKKIHSFNLPLRYLIWTVTKRSAVVHKCSLFFKPWWFFIVFSRFHRKGLCILSL